MLVDFSYVGFVVKRVRDANAFWLEIRDARLHLVLEPSDLGEGLYCDTHIKFQCSFKLFLIAILFTELRSSYWKEFSLPTYAIELIEQNRLASSPESVNDHVLGMAVFDAVEDLVECAELTFSPRQIWRRDS